MAKYIRVKNHRGDAYVIFGGMWGSYARLLRECQDASVPIDIVYGWRGEKEQNDFLAQGLSKAKFGQSPHNYGLAFDYCPLDEKGRFLDASTVSDDVWAKIGRIVVQVGFGWGGNFTTIKDQDHAENTDWKELIQDGTCPLLKELPDESDIQDV